MSAEVLAEFAREGVVVDRVSPTSDGGFGIYALGPERRRYALVECHGTGAIVLLTAVAGDASSDVERVTAKAAARLARAWTRQEAPVDSERLRRRSATR